MDHFTLALQGGAFVRLRDGTKDSKRVRVKCLSVVSARYSEDHVNCFKGGQNFPLP